MRLLAAAVLLLVSPICAAERLPLTNGALAAWEDGKPVGWEVAVGAQNGRGGESRLEPVEKGGLRLAGDASTAVWRSVGQRFTPNPGAFYRLTFEARASDLKREGRQFNNCYAGLFFFDGAGKRLAMQFRDLFEPDWASGQVVAKAPDDAIAAEVMVFLSKTGTLEVRNLAIEELALSDSFDVLDDELGRYYSFLALKEVDWKGLTERHRDAAEAAKTPSAFVEAIRPMLAELKDLHVTIVAADGEQVPSHVSKWERNFDFQAVAKGLQGPKQFGRIGFTGRTPQGYGYVAIGSLGGDEQTFSQLVESVEGMLDAPGFVVDLRGNSGGSEERGRLIASLFADRPRLYAKSQVRAGGEPKNVQVVAERMIGPREGMTYSRPIVCLIGPGCVSSGEGMALMMDALPHVTTVGQPTRGASGNPQPVALPNGVTVMYSTWVTLLPDDTPLEERGVVPDVAVDHDGAGDPTFEAALKALGERVRGE